MMVPAAQGKFNWNTRTGITFLSIYSLNFGHIFSFAYSGMYFANAKDGYESEIQERQNPAPEITLAPAATGIKPSFLKYS